MIPDKGYIVKELAKSADVPESQVKVAILPQAKQVHMFVLKDMDEDDIMTESLRQYVRQFGYRHQIFAASNIKMEVFE